MLTASLTALFYLYNIVFNTVFVFYTKYQFEDEKAGWERSKGKWHKYGMAMRVMAYAGPFVGVFSLPHTNWKDWLLCGVLIMPLWDIMINVEALGMAPLYNGATSTLDKKFKGIKWIMYALLLIGAIIIKFTY